MTICTCVIYAWCLMTNHFHLQVIEGDWRIEYEDNVSIIG